MTRVKIYVYTCFKVVGDTEHTYTTKCSHTHVSLFNFMENRTMETIEAVINKIQSAFNITLNVVEDDKTFTVHYNDQFVVLGKFFSLDVIYEKICTFVQIQLLQICTETLIDTVRSLPYGTISDLSGTLNSLNSVRFSLERSHLAELEKRIHNLTP